MKTPRGGVGNSINKFSIILSIGIVIFVRKGLGFNVLGINVIVIVLNFENSVGLPLPKSDIANSLDSLTIPIE